MRYRGRRARSLWRELLIHGAAGLTVTIAVGWLPACVVFIEPEQTCRVSVTATAVDVDGCGPGSSRCEQEHSQLRQWAYCEFEAG